MSINRLQRTPLNRSVIPPEGGGILITKCHGNSTGDKSNEGQDAQ